MIHRRLWRTAVLVGLTACLPACSSRAPSTADIAASRQALGCVPSNDVLTQHNNSQRQGLQNECALTPSTVTPSTFGKLYDLPVIGQVYAQPLYVHAAFQGKDVLYVATEENYVYAFDAHDTSGTPLWVKQLGRPVGASVLSSLYSPTCTDLTPSVGITGTPVIDLVRRKLYVVAKVEKRIGGNFGSVIFQYVLHALDLSTGGDMATVIRASTPGTGAGGALGQMPFEATYQLQRPGLLLFDSSSTYGGTQVAVAFGSHCDFGRYHGWVLTFDASTLALKHTYNTTASGNGLGGAIWQGGTGLTMTPSTGGSRSSIYFETGNGSYDTTSSRTPTTNSSNAILGILPSSGPGFDMDASFFPSNVDVIEQGDMDIGSAGLVSVKNSDGAFVIGGSKEGVLYVLNASVWHGNVYSSSGDAIYQEVQLPNVSPSSRGMLFGNGVVLDGPSGWSSFRLFVWGGRDPLPYAFDWSPYTHSFGTSPVAGQSMPDTARSWRGAALSVTTVRDPTTLAATPSTGILWATVSDPGNRLVAYDARTLTILYDSSANCDDRITTVAKFTPPTIVDGRVFVATFDNKVSVFGQLPTPRTVDGGTATCAPLCPDAVDPLASCPDDMTASFHDVYTRYLAIGTVGSCGNPNCHGGTTGAGGFSVGTTETDFYNALRTSGLVSTTNPAGSRLNDRDLTPLAWFGTSQATCHRGTMPQNNPVDNGCAASAIDSWLRHGGNP